MNFEDLALDAKLQRAIAEAGYKQATPIQAQAIPAVLDGEDVLAAAQTGTGKTAAFTLPLLEILHRQAVKQAAPRVLILAPTRELAAQIGDSLTKYGRHMQHKHVVIFGGVNAKPQIEKLRRKPELIVATPGRLLDLHGSGDLNLEGIQTLVLDEADRMLDMGFIHDIKRILKVLPKQRQNLMFSATFSPEIRKLAQGIVRDPVEVDVAPRNSAAQTVKQQKIRVPKAQKRELLSWLIDKRDWHHILVFTRTKHGANRLCKQLISDEISAAAIHGNKSQNARTQALADFKARKLRVLVATDIAARGIDIMGLPHVINYELPMVAEDYVHRIGRTGRAGASGHAVSLYCGEELKQLKAIEKLLKKSIPDLKLDDYLVKEDTSTPADAPVPGRSAQAKSKSERKPKDSKNPGQRRRKPRTKSGAAKKAGADTKPQNTNNNRRKRHRPKQTGR